MHTNQIHHFIIERISFCILHPGRETLGMDSKVLVSVVLEEDGTIVEDEAYFMCLPPNTKFMILHIKERWGPAMRGKIEQCAV